jgi:lysophospholipase L1-like esterase
LDGRYDTESEAYTVLVEVMARFYREVAEDGAIPVALLLPAKPDIERAWQGKPVSYEPLLVDLEKRGIETIDAMDAFTAESEITDWRGLIDGHYTAEGNRRVADLLYERLAPMRADAGT